MNIVTRSCTLGDFDAVFELLKQLWPDTPLDYASLQAVFKNAIHSDNQKLITALIGNEAVGFCSLTIKNNLWLSGNLGHVDELIVDQRYRGQGIGRLLLDKIALIAAENKCRRVELDSAFHRKEAHRFYEGIGFENRAYLFSKVL